MMLQTYADAHDAEWEPGAMEDDFLYAPIPDIWTPDHVARRLIEAFAIDRRLPRVQTPKAPGSAHPQVEYTAEEREEWERIPLDPAKAAPTRDEIADMQRRLDWLQWVREVDIDACLALRAWALRMAGGGASLRSLARKLRTSAVKILRRKDKAAKIIADILMQQGESVF